MNTQDDVTGSYLKLVVRKLGGTELLLGVYLCSVTTVEQTVLHFLQHVQAIESSLVYAATCRCKDLSVIK